MNKLSDVKESIEELYRAKKYLPAFSLQAMYIESVLKAYVDARFKIEVSRKITDINLSKSISNVILSKRTSNLIDEIKKYKWISTELKIPLKDYLEFRNDVFHELHKEIGKNSFENTIKKYFLLGQDIINSSEFLNTDTILTVLDNNKFIYGHGKIFTEDDIGEDLIYTALKLKLDGLTNEEISAKTKINPRYINQILNNKLAREIEIDIETKDLKKKADIEKRDHVLNEIEKILGISKKSILQQNRKKDLSFARHIAMYILNKKLGVSSVQTGKILGGRDHTTVLSAVEKVKVLILAGRVKTKVSGSS